MRPTSYASLIAIFLATLSGCDFIGDVIYGPVRSPEEVAREAAEQPANGGRSPITIPVPLAARDIPSDHQILPDDIVLQELTLDDIDRQDWLTHEMMMSQAQIEGRVTKYKLSKGMPFYVSGLYLEGTEPGAPPELDTPDPPWPELSRIELLINALAGKGSEALTSESDTVHVPIASSNLPAGRRIRKSDVGFIAMTQREIVERAYPDFEVLLSPEQFVGRRLRKAKSQGSVFLLSDFEVNSAVSQYLTDQQQ